MSLALDHVVIAVADLAATIEDYRRLGFTVQVGGDHPGRTSHNALVVFEDGSYLELIAWRAPAPQERWYVHHQTHGDGFVDFALLPDDVGARVASAKSRGLVLTGPIDGGRVRPDGLVLKWQTARPATQDLPFLCGDVTPRAGRVPEGACRQHANGALGISRVTLAVRDLAASASRYRALLGDAAVAAEAAEPAGRYAEVALLGCTVRLVAGEPGGQPLGAQGEGLRAVAFRCAPGASPGFDRALSHGAAFSLEG